MEPWAAAPEALLAVPPLAELPAAPWEASPMLGPEPEQRKDEQAPAEVPEAEGLTRRVESRVAARAQAVEATQRLGPLPERRELEAEPPELQLPKGSPAA